MRRNASNRSIATARPSGAAWRAVRAGIDLGVGGDRAGDAQAVGHLEVAVVVHVAVEDPDEVRRHLATALLQLLAVDGVGVGLGDDPDAGPAGVPEHGDLRSLGLQRLAQEGVLLDLVPQRPGVVAELPDLGRRLVHDRQRRADEPRRARLEQGVARAAGQRGGDVGVRGHQPVVPHQDVHAGGVAAAHLHAIDRRQGLLDRQVAGERAPSRRPARPGRPRRWRCAAGPGAAATARRAARSGRRCRAPTRRGRRRRRPRRGRRRSRRRRRRAGRGDR